MKAISIRQPWAWAILNAGKRVENRDWRGVPTYRGPILIHAAKGCTRDEHLAAARAISEAGTDMAPALPLLDRGGLVGRARLVDVVFTTTGGHRTPHSRRGPAAQCALCGERAAIERYGERCPKADPWAVPGAYGLVLADVEPLPFLPWKGKLGLFDVIPPPGSPYAESAL